MYKYLYNFLKNVSMCGPLQIKHVHGAPCICTASRKNQKVKDELLNMKRTNGLWRMESTPSIPVKDRGRSGR